MTDSSAVKPNAPKKRRGRRGSKLRRAGKQGVIDLIGQENFYKARIYAHIKGGALRQKDLLLIHQMGKVGSTSISASLKAMGLRDQMAVFQTHFLSEQGRAFLHDLAIEGYGGWEQLPEKARQDHIRADLLGDHVRQMRQDGKRVRVITLVRDPVATNVSGFFHKNEWWPSSLREICQDESPACLNALRERFMSSYPHDVPLDWFDMEMLPVFGIDVFATPFPKEQGYDIYRNEFADVLLIKLEKLDDCGEAALEELLNLGHVEFIRANTASDKWYSPLYSQFKRSLNLPDSYLDQMYDSKFTRQFYTDVEIQAFRSKWRSESRS